MGEAGVPSYVPATAPMVIADRTIRAAIVNTTKSAAMVSVVCFMA